MSLYIKIAWGGSASGTKLFYCRRYSLMLCVYVYVTVHVHHTLSVTSRYSREVFAYLQENLSP